MLSHETMEGVHAIVAAHEADLLETVDLALQASQELADAKNAVTEAEEAVRTANQNLTDAKNLVRSQESKKQHSQGDVERAARGIAVNIASDITIDPLPRTLYSLIYSDRRFAWQQEPDAYRAAAARGELAISAIVERLQVGEPLLLFEQGDVIADTAKEETLIAALPTVKPRSGSYALLEGGSIDVVLPNASKAARATQGLVKVTQEPAEVTLISQYYGHDVDRLEAASSNAQWLVIGDEAIAAKMEQLDPNTKLMALTALKAAGIKVPIELEAGKKLETEEQLVSLICFLSAGTGQETTSRIVRGRHHRGQITSDTPLTVMANTIDKQSIRHIASAVGLTKEALRKKAEAVLQSRTANDGTTLDQLTKDLQSLTNVDRLLDVIFER